MKHIGVAALVLFLLYACVKSEQGFRERHNQWMEDRSSSPQE